MVKRRNFLRTIATGVVGFQIFPRRAVKSLTVAKDVSTARLNDGVSKALLQLNNGPAVGPLRKSGLQYLGQLRERRSPEISGSRWGVWCGWIADEHPLSVEQRLDHLSTTGAKLVLLVPDWNRIEQVKGKYDWNTPGHRLDDVVNGLASLKITPIIQVYGGNRLYMKTEPDVNNRLLADAALLLDDPVVRQAWHRYLEAMVRRYKKHVKVWEIWNEPNGSWFWATPTTVKDYGRMVRDVAAVIRSVQSKAVVLAGATAMVSLPYLEGFLPSEGSNSFDRWSVHPYGELPESSEKGILDARELLRKQGKSDVLWQSECGFPSSAETGGWGWGGPWDETKHAKWLLRRLLTDARMDMPVSIYFALHDYPCVLELGPDKGKMGINRKGLYRYDTWEPKSAAYALTYLSSLLDDRFENLPAALSPRFESAGSDSLPASKSELIKTYLLRHKSDKQPALVYWLGTPMETEFQPVSITLTLPGATIAEPVLVDLLDGRVYALPGQVQTGEFRFKNLPLADSPIVLCSRTAVELKQ